MPAPRPPHDPQESVIDVLRRLESKVDKRLADSERRIQVVERRSKQHDDTFREVTESGTEISQEQLVFYRVLTEQNRRISELQDGMKAIATSTAKQTPIIEAGKEAASAAKAEAVKAQKPSTGVSLATTANLIVALVFAFLEAMKHTGH